MSSDQPTLTAEYRWVFHAHKDIITNARISRSARLLYCVLQSYVGPTSANPFPSLASLCRDTGAGRHSVQKWMKELETIGLIARKHRSVNGRFISNSYSIFDSPKDTFSTAINRPTKKYQYKESKESKESPNGAATLNDRLASLQRQAKAGRTNNSIKTSFDSKSTRSAARPTRDEFEEFVQEHAPMVAVHRPDLYDYLASREWQHANFDTETMDDIQHWRRYVLGLDRKIAAEKGLFAAYENPFEHNRGITVQVPMTALP